MQELRSELDSIRKKSRSINNRIQSILFDANFVLETSKYFQRPLVANKRCGSWYVPTENCISSCYFKSTDGHTHQWSFSIRRLNLHLLPLIERHNGLIIVDSTRRGKLMPDAASKTIPIWCSVINLANGFGSQVWTPPTVVSKSERDQIASKLEEWVTLLKSTASDYKISKPLRPMWFNHGDEFQDPPPELPSEFFPVIICTASFQAQDGQFTMKGFTYVQGAADDHELWAGTLTPEHIWQHPELRENKSDADLEKLINSIAPISNNELFVPLTNHVSYSSVLPTHQTQKCVIDVREGAPRWPLPTGKKGSRVLSNNLLPICDYFEECGPDALIVSDSMDFAASIALMLDCLYFDVNGLPLGKKRLTHVPKDEVNQRLAKISSAAGSVPSRTTLNIVGSFMRR